MERKCLLAAAFLGLLACPLEGQIAERLYQQACDGGDMLGCDLLGLMYRDAVDVTQNLARAATLFQQACDGEMMQSCDRLGVMYANGVGVTQDVARSLSLFQKACDGAEMQGCNNLEALVGLMRVALLEQLPLEGRTLTMGAEGFGTLSDADPEGPDGSYVQAWALELSAGQEVTASLASSDFDAFLLVTGPGLEWELSDDDSGGGCDARITFIAPEDGEYRAIVNAAAPGQTGQFLLRATDTPPTVAPGFCRRSVGRRPETLPPAVEASMHIAVLEHVLASDVMRAGEEVAAICVGLGETGEEPPSPGILSPFSGSEPPIVASAGCTRSVDAATSLPIIQTSGGAPGMFLTMVEAPEGRERVVMVRIESDGVEPRTLLCRVDTAGPETGTLQRVLGAGAGNRIGSAGGSRRPPAAQPTWNPSNVRWEISGC